MSGRNVMMGYLFCQDKTTEAIDDDGWLHSGTLNVVFKMESLYLSTISKLRF
jgi:long-subunit acyl-CoA synthetase (AMP-forming)